MFPPTAKKRIMYNAMNEHNFLELTIRRRCESRAIYPQLFNFIMARVHLEGRQRAYLIEGHEIQFDQLVVRQVDQF